MGLLDDLKRQAEIVRTHDDVRRSTHAENVQVVDDAMRRSFLYLHDLLEQLKVIKPVNPVVYRLPGIADLCDLTYADSFVTYRTKLINDKEHYDRVEVFVTWGSPDELVIERDMPAAADKVRQLFRLHLRQRANPPNSGMCGGRNPDCRYLTDVRGF